MNEVAQLRAERDRLRAELELWKAASVRCPVSGVFSRRFLDTWLEREMFRTVRYERPLSAALASIDRLDSLVLRYGPSVRDRILANVGELLERTCRRSDVVARFDDDTFAIVLPETVLFSAREVAAVLCAQVCQHDWASALDDASAPVTVSVGVAQAGTSLEALWRGAARNLDLARAAGRNRVHAG